MWKRWWIWIFVCGLVVLIMILGWYLLRKQPEPQRGTLVRLETGVWKNV